MKLTIGKSHIQFQKKITTFIDAFETSGIQFGNPDRNSIKIFNLDGQQINIKSFKVPNFINQVVYNFFRKSKAQRSFEYASKLLSLGIGTPTPIAFCERSTLLLFKKSYYISKHVNCDLTFRELTTNLEYPDSEQLIRSFTRFTFDLHQKGVNFLDHSPGNTLITKTNDSYNFMIVDLNRMKFGKMDFNTKIANFAKLTIHKSIVEIMSAEYAKLINENYDKVFDLMWKETNEFQKKLYRKGRLKKKLKFWKRR
jgi:hypothetical protein